jgi:soluble lytic murein transglycosylase-like protein
LQVPQSAAPREYARQVLSALRQQPQFPPLAAAAAEAADDLLQDATRSARGSAVGADEQLAAYYRPVLVRLMDAAIRLHLTVQAAADGSAVLVPGALVCSEREGAGMA